MESMDLNKSTVRCSLVVALIDAHTGQPATDSKIQVRLTGVRQPPIRKSGGLFVFLDLPADTYSLQVTADRYLSESIIVDRGALDPEHPVVTVVLMPSPRYPFASGTTLLRGLLRGGENQAMADVELSALLRTDLCARAKVAQDVVTAGSVEFALVQTLGRLYSGETLWVQSKSGAVGERVVIADVREDGRFCRLQTPLQGEYTRGATLLPLIKTRSDQRGEWVLALGSYRCAEFDLTLYCGTTAMKEVRVREGTMHSLGFIHVVKE